MPLAASSRLSPSAPEVGAGGYGLLQDDTDEEEQSQAKTDPLRILVVEDHAPLRRLLVSCLQREGHVVGSADCGDGVIERLQREPVDVVLTDVIMPGKEGVQLMLELRQMAPRPKLIAMSGGGAMSAEIYLGIARSLGVGAVLRKPFSVRTLLDTLQLVTQQ